MALQKLKSKHQRHDMSVRAALSSVGWKPDTPAKSVIEYSVLDFEFAERPKMESFMDFESRSLDFFVADPRGYGSIFLKMADNFRDRILLNKIVNQVSYTRYGIRVTAVNGETFTADYGLCTFSTSVLASDSVIFSPKLPRWKVEAINKFHWHITQKFLSSFPTNSGIAMSSSCTLTVSEAITQYGWILKHVIFYQGQPSYT